MTGGAPPSESDPRGNDDAPMQGRGGGPGPYHPNNRGPDRGGGGYRRSPSPLHSGDRRRSSPSPPHPGRRSRGGRSRSVTPPPGGGGGGSGRRPRRSSRSWSRSRSRSPRGGRYHRDHHHHMRDHHHRDPYRDYNNERLPPYRDSGPYHRDDGGGRGDYNRGPPPDFPGRRGGDRRDLAGPPPYHRSGSGPPDNGHSDSGPRGGGGGDRRGGRGGGGPEGPPGVSLLVRNIAPDITTADLQNAFGRIGVIRDVYVPRDYHSQQPRGFAFIEYATPEMAREAKHEMNRFVIKGHEIEVVFAQERRKTPGEMRGRSADAPDDDRAAPPSRSGDRGDRGGGRGVGSGFERSSSFERHKQRERDDHGRKDRDSRPSGNRDDDDDAPRP